MVITTNRFEKKKKKNLIKEASKIVPNDSLLPRGPSGHVIFDF